MVSQTMRTFSFTIQINGSSQETAKNHGCDDSKFEKRGYNPSKNDDGSTEFSFGGYQTGRSGYVVMLNCQYSVVAYHD